MLDIHTRPGPAHDIAARTSSREVDVDIHRRSGSVYRFRRLLIMIDPVGQLMAVAVIGRGGDLLISRVGEPCKAKKRNR